MSDVQSDFLNVLPSAASSTRFRSPTRSTRWRSGRALTAYIGFDCTAPSLHVGSLIPIMMLYWLQQTGHRPIALMGGGTTRVGDPSGKDESRRLLTDEDIDANLAGIRAVFAKFLSFGAAPGDAVMANNADWLNDAQLHRLPARRRTPLLRQPHARLRLVKLRLDRQQELSFLEFNYMILQAYDFVELHRRDGCVLQMGGSDQWGNIVSGIDLGRRMANAQLFALTSPLLTTSSGAKMGKTAAGAVWLNRRPGEPVRLLAILAQHRGRRRRALPQAVTILPLDEIARLAQLRGADINEAKKVLATEATALVHGRAAAEAAAGTARQTFEEGTLAASLPTVEIARVELEAGLGVLTAFAEKAQLVASNGEARRQIKAAGLKVNDITVTDEKAVLTPADLTVEGVIKLSLGKKRHVLLKPV